MVVIPFEIPPSLGGPCRAAGKPIEQIDFLKQLEQHAKEQGFYYNRDDLRRFHTSVLCEGLTILAGPSGVGKSSLARIYGEVLAGADAPPPRDGTLVVHVSPAWMERADILGFVNTITGDFSPSETGLYQRLIYAQEDYATNNRDSAMYPICLDEMNLSQIEHYFSDFIQLLESSSGDRALSCFSPEAVKPDSIFQRFAKIELAPSLRFIGTVNFDETTRKMSMRLLDRVNLIYLSDEPQFPLAAPSEELRLGGVSMENYLSWIRTEKLSSNLDKCLTELRNPLKKFGIGISPRVRKAMEKYIASSKDLIDSGPTNTEQIAFDEQIAQRVLSKIRTWSTQSQREALDNIREILSEHCGNAIAQSGRLLDELLAQGPSFSFPQEEDATGN